MRLVIYGASGHGREVCWAARAAAEAGLAQDDVAGFVDDDPSLAGSDLAGRPVLGGAEALEPEDRVLLGVGYPEVKRRVVGKGPAAGVSWPALVHPRASLGDRVTVGRGALVQAGCVLSSDIRVGPFVTLNLGCTVSHDCVLEEFSTLSPGVHLGGNVVVEEGAFLGIGASVIQGVTVGAWSTVGAGAVVVRDVPPNVVVAGVPARPIETREPGWQGA